jgi:hypothetical protein
MHPIADAIVATAQTIDVLFQWGLGWRYVFSPSFRQTVRTRWRKKSRASAVGEAMFAGIAFLIVNILLAAVVYRVLVGPIPAVHEWRS